MDINATYTCKRDLQGDRCGQVIQGVNFLVYTFFEKNLQLKKSAKKAALP